MFGVSILSHRSEKKVKRQISSVLLYAMLFVCLSLPVFAGFTLSTSSTSSGGGTWGSILRMEGSISGDYLYLTVQKQSGTFKNTNNVYIKVDGYSSSAQNAATGSIGAGGYECRLTVNLSSYMFPKGFYARVVNSDGYAYVGPINVYWNNRSPNIPSVVSEPTSGTAGKSLTYSYRISDPDGDRVKAHISFGDGTSTWDSGLRSSGSTVSCSHAYGSAGTYNMYITVFDEHGSGSSTRHVEVRISDGNNNPNYPVVLNEPGTGGVGEVLTYTYKISDPDNDRVKIHLSFGDGTSTWDSGLKSSGSQVSHTHTYTKAGTYDMYISVFDEHGAGSSTRHHVVNVTANRNPNNPVVVSEPASGGVGQSLTYSYKISDPDNDRVKIHINFGDGTTKWDSGLMASGSRVSRSHTYSKAGTYDMYIAVFDEHGAGSSTRHHVVTVSAGNSAPNNPTVLNEPTTGSAGAPLIFTYKISDPDKDRVKMQISWGDGTTKFDSGLASSGARISQAHTYNAAGTYHLYATVFDEHGASCSTRHAVVTITGGNRKPNDPIAVSEPVSGNTGIPLNFIYELSDPDNDRVKCEINWGDGTSTWKSILVESGARVSKTHSYGSSGTYTGYVTVFDENGNASNTRQFVVNVSDTDRSINFLSPIGGGTVSGTRVEIQATIKCDIGLTGLSLYIDDQIVDTFTTGVLYDYTYRYTWDTSSYSNGSHTIKLIVFDKNNQYFDTQMTVTVHNAGDVVSVNDINVANVGETAGQFHIWMDVTKNGTSISPTGYKVNIVNPDNSTEVYASQVNINALSVENKRWRVQLDINKKRGLFFENGILQIVDQNGAEFYRAPASKFKLSVYGTDFDMQQHSYRFTNGHWKNTPNEDREPFLRVGETIAECLDKKYKGKFYVESEDVEFGGLCYGMAHSAVANYNHKNDPGGYWGGFCSNYKYNICNWNEKNTTDNDFFRAMDDRWEGGDPPTGPLRPFPNGDIYTETYDGNNARWTVDAAKKIMYYHITQKYFQSKSYGWVGKDKKKEFSFPDIKRIITKNNVVLLSLKYLKLEDFWDNFFGENGSHGVTVTQLIRYNDKLKLVFYDNNFPIPRCNRMGCAYFSEITFYDLDDYTLNRYHLDFTDAEWHNLQVLDGEYIFFSGVEKKFKYGKILTKLSSSQKIYNYPGGKAPAFSFQEAFPLSRRAEPEGIAGKLSANYAEIVVIGAKKFQVYNHNTSEKINMSHNGVMDGTTAVYRHDNGSILTTLFLPANDTLYRVEITKDSAIPRLKIFPYVPKGGNKVQSTGYDNLHFTKTDATKAIFLVGKNNTNYRLQRTSTAGSTDEIEPDFIDSVAMADSINVQSPNGGEIWTAGTKKTITWSSNGSIEDVKIEYSIDGGNLYMVLSSATKNDGSFSWTIPSVNSSKCRVRISDASNEEVYDINESYFTISSVSQGETALTVSRYDLRFKSIAGNIVTGAQKVLINNSGGGVLNWTASPSKPWIVVSPSSGMGNGVMEVSVNPAGFEFGSDTGMITVADPNAKYSPLTIYVTLSVIGSGSRPIGQFLTPGDGAVVCSSIPVTGWALDDVGIESVKIYRDNGIYIGDALFVEGARPDLEQAYPDYPMNYRAGWGYMLLTNFLPNGGNGTFRLYAIATDKEGNQVAFGFHTITCDNANAVKPFGAIDTPKAGGTVAGSNYINTGWVLTPKPNKIPEDGSTIFVYVDGVKIGSPGYNQYRSDIAGFFPGYANSNGAKATFHFNTNVFDNGLHTIQWTARDSGNNEDGIGSRFFSILNSGLARTNRESREQASRNVSEISGVPVSFSSVGVLKGYGAEDAKVQISPDSGGVSRIKIKELERVVVRFASAGDNNTDLEIKSAGHRYVGYQIVGEQLRPLPTGSTLDVRRGVFYWQPGPGFVGSYRFVFLKKMRSGETTRILLEIEICTKL
jgi:plastocyanin